MVFREFGRVIFVVYSLYMSKKEGEKHSIKNESILEVTRAEQYKTVEELFERSHKNSVYYTLLVLSTFIITAGLLLNNAVILIGGMLVAPVMTPILVIALGFAVGDMDAVKSVLKLLFQSFVLLIVSSFFLALIFGVPENMSVFENSMRTAVLYFIVATSSGVVATFAWIRREVKEVLPGVAMAVSLVPPLGLIGVWLAAFNWTAAQFYLYVFLFNFIGIFVGSLLVFTLLKFHRIERKVHQESEEAKQLND